MANESKDSYESALKQHGRKEFPAVLVDGRGNWNDFARTTNKNFHAQRLDSPELDVSLAMQEGGLDAAKQRILEHLVIKTFEQSINETIARTVSQLIPDLHQNTSIFAGAAVYAMMGGAAGYAYYFRKKKLTDYTNRSRRKI